MKLLALLPSAITFRPPKYDYCLDLLPVAVIFPLNCDGLLALGHLSACEYLFFYPGVLQLLALLQLPMYDSVSIFCLFSFCSSFFVNTH